MNTTASGPAAASAATPAATHAAFSSSYTHLEALLLFQSVLKFGIGADAFPRIAAVLQENALIRSDDSYDASRLSAESLQALFLHLLHNETTTSVSSGSGGGGDGSGSNGSFGGDDPQQRQHPLSPTASASVPSRKRKLPDNATATPTLRDALARADQLPVLIEHLYARYRDNVVNSIREYESRFARVQADIQTLEREVEEAEQAEQQNNQPRALAQQQEPAAASTTAPGAGEKGALIAPKPIPAANPLNANTTANSATPHLPAAAAATPLPVTASPGGKSPLGRTVGQGNPLLPATARPATHPPTETRQNEPQPGSASPRPGSAPAPSDAPGASSISPQLPVQTASSGLAPRAPAAPPALGQAQLLHQASAAQAGQASSPATPQLDQQAAGVELERKTENVVPTVPATGSNTPTPNASQMSSSASLPAPPRASPAMPSIPVEAATAGSQRIPQAGTNKPPIATFSTATSSQVGAGKKGSLVGGFPTPQAAASASSATAPIASSRPLLPAGMRTSPSRTPTPVQSPLPILPHTPSQTIGFIPRGSGTRWKPSDRITSTPGLGIDDIASPAYEPLSPIQPGAASRGAPVDGAEAFAISPSASGSMQRQPWHSRKAQFATRSRRADLASTRSRGGRPTRHGRFHSETDDGSFSVKHEDSAPNAGDGIAEMAMDTDDLDSSRMLKRKRDESVDFASPSDGGPDHTQYQQARRRLVGPPTPPTHVLWTRGFPRISASALDQISSHRHANMFAHKIRDRDAPGYGSIVRHPVDLKSIRMAITQGNKAAMAMAATLPESDQQSASSLWLPISEDLVPPRGIINSSQLECELMHMFANAVMYNPDSHRGPGPTFMTSHEVADDDTAGIAGGADGSGNGGGGGYGRYKVDEDGVVNDTRDMYVEVEKLLSEMRSAEKQRGAPPPPADARGLDLPNDDSGLVGLGISGRDAEETHPGSSGRREDDAADDTATDGAGPGADAEESSTSKRRRITRGQ